MSPIRWYQKIQYQIPLIVFLIILIPAAAFGSYDISTSRQAQLENTRAAMAERLYETSLLTQDIMQEIETAGKKLVGDRSFLDLLKAWQLEPSNAKLRSGLLLAMGQSAWQCPYIEQMVLISEDFPLLLSSDPTEKLLDKKGSGEMLYQTYRDQMKGQTTWALYPEAQTSIDGASHDSIAYWRSIQTNDEETQSSLVCILKKEYLDSVMTGLQSRESGLSAIGSYQGRVLYLDSQETGLGENLSKEPLFQEAYSGQENAGSYFADWNGVRWLVAYYNSLEDGWKYLSAIPEQQIYTGIADRKFIYVLLFAGCFGMVLGSLILYFLVVNPLSKLQKKMELMESGQLETLDFTGGKNEIGQVLQAYDHMIVRLRKLIDEVYVQQLLRKQAELSSLQSQMDEHFLYNTLNTIYCKASEENAKVSAAMILKLSQYFRLSLARGQEKIPLDEIVKLIRAYLQIQQMRYGQTLTCRMETFPDMEQFISLKQIYQPIIENAVIHGFERKLGSHSLEIKFQKAGERLRFIVQDDGVGMPEEKCREVIAQMSTFEQVPGKGYALRNIREQIRIVYGDDYGIQMDSCWGKGTTVVLEVPLERRTPCAKEQTEHTP